MALTYATPMELVTTGTKYLDIILNIYMHACMKIIPVDHFTTITWLKYQEEFCWNWQNSSDHLVVNRSFLFAIWSSSIFINLQYWFAWFFTFIFLQNKQILIMHWNTAHRLITYHNYNLSLSVYTCKFKWPNSFKLKNDPIIKHTFLKGPLGTTKCFLENQEQGLPHNIAFPMGNKITAGSLLKAKTKYFSYTAGDPQVLKGLWKEIMDQKSLKTTDNVMLIP